MKKLRVDIEQLQVESFETAGAPQKRGTVQAHGPDTDTGTCPPTGDAYCSYGHACTYPQYTCGGWECQTWGEFCWRPSERETCVACID